MPSIARNADPAPRRAAVRWVPILALALLLSGPGARSQAPAGPPPDPPRPEIPARVPELLKTYANALPYVHEAERQGVAVDEPEIGLRAETYRKLYPGTLIEMRMVRAILLAEKYLDRQGPGTGDEAAAARPGDLEGRGFRGEAELESAARALRTKALFEREEIRSGGRRLMYAERLRKQMGRPAPQEAWTPGELQIPGAPEACVAHLGVECFVTVEEFNAAAGQVEYLRDMPLDSARMGVVRTYALAKASAGTREPGEPEWDERELLGSYRKIREGSRWLKAAREFGLPEVDAHILQVAYRTYHGRHFRAREEAGFDLIGSSDSAYVDSLHALLAARMEKAALPGGAPLAAGPEPDLPWMALREEELPPELTAPTDTFRVGEFTAPIRTPYGFFIVRLSRLRPVKEIPFPEAQGALIYLATRDKFLELDTLPEVKMRRYYERNLPEFDLPDTLSLRAWLAPSAAGRAAGRAAAPPPPPDTLRFRPRRLSSLDLPGPVRLELQAAARKAPRKTFFGPFEGRYGRWHFQVTRARRADGRIPYAAARRAIREKLFSGLPSIAGDTLTSEAAKDKVMLNLALARNRMRFRAQRLQEKVAGDIAERIRSGAFDTAAFVDGRERRRAERLARSRLEEEIRAGDDADDKAFLDRIRVVSGRIGGRTDSGR